MFKFLRRADSASRARAEIGVAVGCALDADPKTKRIEMATVQGYVRPDFLNARQCATLIKMIDAKRRPSTLLSGTAAPDFRTSESCDMDRWSPEVRPIDEAIAALLGLPPQQGETMQGQRYAPGQHFRAHHDYFFQSEGYWKQMKGEGGQRTWTAMIYLNDVAEGGATWFPRAGIRIAPKRGLLLTWNNMTLDGSPNAMTHHEGMSVVKGTKYIVTKWFREQNWTDLG